MQIEAQIELAELKVAAIDKRIDVVRAEMWRMAGIDPDAFDYDTQDGLMVACRAFGNARRDFPAYDGIEHSLFLRRHDAAGDCDHLIAKKARAAERRANRELRKQSEARRHACPTCGDVHYADAA